MECKNCGLGIQDSYLYCPSCGSPSYSSLYSELIKIDYFLSEFDTWLEEGLVDQESILPITERYLAKKQELLTLLQSSEEVIPFREEDILRELKERIVERSFDKTKKLFEEELRELIGESMEMKETSQTLPEAEQTLEETAREGVEEEIWLTSSDLRFFPAQSEESKETEPPIPVCQEAQPVIQETSKVKIFLSSGLKEEPHQTPSPPEEIPSPFQEGSLSQQQIVIIFLTITGVFSIFFFSLHLPLSYYAPILMLVGAAAVLTGYHLTLNTKQLRVFPYPWVHPLTLTGYVLTFLALGLSLKGFMPGIIAVTLTLATILYIISAYVYKSPFFVYLSTLSFSFLYLITLFQLNSVVEGGTFKWFSLSLPATCFALIPLTVLTTYLGQQFANLENGKLSKPLYQFALALSLAILLVTLGMLHVETQGRLSLPSFQTLLFPSHVASYKIAWALAVFLAYSSLYAICSYLYERAAFVYLANLLLVLSVGLGISYLGREPLLPLSLCALSYFYFLIAHAIQKDLRLKADLDLYGKETSIWQKKIQLYSYPILHVAMGISVLALIMAWNNPLVLFLSGIFCLLLILLYPSKYWMYPAGILFIGSVYFSWITQLPVKSWDSVVILTALALFMLGYIVQVSQRTLCETFSLREQDYQQPFFNLSIFLFFVSLGLYITDLNNIISDSYTLLLSIVFCGLGFYLKGEMIYLVLLFLLTFVLNFSFWTASLKEINFDYLSLSSSLLTLGWLGVTYLVTRPSGNQILEKLNLSISDQVKRAVTDIFYPLVFIYTLVSLLLTLGRLSLATILSVFIVGTIYTCYAYVFKSNKWLYGANLAINIGVFYLILWLRDLVTSGGNPYLITGYLGLAAVGLSYGWTYLGKYYEIQARLPGQAHLKNFAVPHFFMAWTLLPAFVVLMSGLFLGYVPSPQPGSFSLHLLNLIGLTALYVWLTGTEQQEKFLYLSEIGLASIILFMRLARPDYFIGGRITLWLILVSFVFMELGYLTKKYQVHILARLAYYTALLLPLMSLMLMTPWGVTGYGVLCVLAVAGFYGWVGSLQPNVSFIYISLFLGNLGLFMLWSWIGLAFVYSPQLYLIPSALTAMGIARLHKSSLPRKVFSSTQFFSTLFILMVSYLEMLLANESWRVDFLAALCLTGILFGLAWRVKAFLYLGSLFLSLNLLSQLTFYLYHSSWMMWGILAGLGLLFTLGWLIQSNKRTTRYFLENATRELSSWE